MKERKIKYLHKEELKELLEANMKKTAQKAAAEMMDCKPCRFCDQKARKNFKPCCTYLGKLEITKEGKCLTGLNRRIEAASTFCGL